MFNKLSKQPKYRKILLPMILVAVLACAIAGLLAHTNLLSKQSKARDTSTSNHIDYSPAKPSDNIPNNERKDTATSDNKSGSDVRTLNTPSSPPSFSVTVSRANAYSNNGETGINAAATINGATAAGTCTFTLTPHDGQGSPITRSEPSQASNTTYICPGINIPAPKGGWDVTVSVSSSGSTASAKWAANPVSY